MGINQFSVFLFNTVTVGQSDGALLSLGRAVAAPAVVLPLSCPCCFERSGSFRALLLDSALHPDLDILCLFLV